VYFSVICVLSVFLQYFDTVGWSFDLQNCVPYNLYCVGGDVKPCSITHTLWPMVDHQMDGMTWWCHE